MPERLTLSALKVHLDAIERSIERETQVISDRFTGVDRTISDNLEALNKVDNKVDEQDDAINQLRLDMEQKFGLMERAQFEAERRVRTEAEQQRLSRNRWIVGTVIATGVSVIGLILDLLKG